MHDEGYGSGKACPALGFGIEALLALVGELVELGAAVVFGGSPAGFEQAAEFESMEGGVERAFFDLEQLLGGLVDPLGDRVAVKRAAGEGFEDEHLQGALDEVAGVVGFFPNHLRGDCLPDVGMLSRGFSPVEGFWSAGHTGYMRLLRFCCSGKVPVRRLSLIKDLLWKVRGGLVVGLCAVVGGPLMAQAPLDAFRWIDFRDAKDAPTVAWVTQTLTAEKWTAIREIGVQWDAAVVVTAQRKTPQSMPAADAYTVWNVSLAKHEAQPLLHVVNPRLLNFTSFGAAGLQAPEMGLVYEDCTGCDAPSTFFTTLYYNFKEHAWRARWVRGDQTAALFTGGTVDGVTRTQVYGLLTDLTGHNLLGTWSHFDYGKVKPAEDFVFEYTVDAMTGLDQTQALSGKPADAMKEKLCRLGAGQASAGADPATAPLAGGQDSELCQELLGTKAKTRPGRRPVTTPPANNHGRSTPGAPQATKP